MVLYVSKCYILFFMIILILIQILMANDKKVRKIAFVVDGSWNQNSKYLELIKKEIIDLTHDEYEILFPEDKMIIGDWNPSEIEAAVSMLLADSEVDLIITPGVIASDAIARKKKLNKPVIAPFILEPDLQGIPLKKGTSGVKNLCYIHTPFTSINTISDFKSVVDFKNLAFLFNKYYLDQIPKLDESIKILTENLGINYFPMKVDDSIDKIFENFPAEVEAVYVSPLLHLPDTEFDKLVIELKKRKLPSFSLLGASGVEKGLLTTNRPDIFPRIARRIALNVQRILFGDKPDEIPVYFSPGEKILINMETARAINIFPNVAVLTEAELINEEDIDSGNTLDLQQAINEAVINNLDIIAKMKYVSGGSENVALARSVLLPQIELSMLGLIIDKDRAETSFGSQPEKTLSGSIQGSQIIFSEPAWANLSIQNSVQSSRESELEQLRLDIALTVSNAFLNVLRIQTFEKINKENLKRTKTNLEMAMVRESIGSAGPAEVFRWESELANNRNSVLKIIAQKNIARIYLNRVLQRDLQERINLIGSNIYSRELAKPENVFNKYLKDPRYFMLIQDYMVVEGLKNSPEIMALEHAITARSRKLSSANNSFWAPTLALQAEYTSIMAKTGAGNDPTASLPGFTLPDDNFWNVGLNLSFPLFEGTKKFADRRQAIDELEQLRLERRSLSQKIEQQIRSILYNVYASFASLTQTKLASQAANKSLEVVQEGYAQGMVSILDLLDAQNTALVSEELASNAVYDFIMDLIKAERTVGKFYLEMDEASAREYLQNFKAYLKKQGS